MKIYLLLFSITFLFLTACQNNNTEEANQGKVVLTSLPGQNDFKEYWYNGEAELTSYKLKQSRYGEIHEGEAVTVFVTEPFSKSKQVKLDNGPGAGKDKVDVLKLNMTKKFYTGVYPYSMMLSAFTPVDRKNDGQTLKVSSSVQEWCGHSFTQYNLDKTSYDVHQFSYFESEGDIKTKLPKAMMEDEIWSMIRINPSLLPSGNFKIIPGSFFGRMRHTEFGQVNASAKLVTLDSGLMEYQINFDKPERKLNIRFTKAFPHSIEEWDETYKSGFGSNAKTLTTSAKINKRIKLDYWSKNNVNDAEYREALGLL